LDAIIECHEASGQQSMSPREVVQQHSQAPLVPSQPIKLIFDQDSLRGPNESPSSADPGPSQPVTSPSRSDDPHATSSDDSESPCPSHSGSADIFDTDSAHHSLSVAGSSEKDGSAPSVEEQVEMICNYFRDDPNLSRHLSKIESLRLRFSDFETEALADTEEAMRDLFGFGPGTIRLIVRKIKENFQIL